MKSWLEEDRRYAFAVAALLVLALSLRIGLVSRMSFPPLFWDEVHYHSAAVRYAGFWRSLLWGEDGASAPTFREVFERSQQKGEVYSAGVGLVYAATGESRQAVLFLQAVVDTISCLLVFGIGRALAGRAVGILALFLVAIYEPLLFTAGRLQTETLATFLCLGGLWAAVASPRKGSTWWHALGGLMTATAMLAKPALQLLLPLFLAAVLLREGSRTWRGSLRAAAVFLVGFALLIGPRLVWTQAAFGEARWTGTSSPGSHVYGGAVIENHGWKTDRQSFAYPPRGELLTVLGDPPQRRATESDQWRAAWRTWFLHPVGSAGVVLHKLYVAWAVPYNDARQEFLSGPAVQRWIHRILLVLALFGMPLALRTPRVGLPLILVAAYLWAIYLVVSIEVRYAIVAMPLMLCFAAVSLVTAYTGVVRLRDTGALRSLIPPGMALLAAALFLELFPLARAVDWLPSLTPGFFHGLRFTVTLCLAVLAGGCLAALLQGTRIRRLVTVAPPVLLMVLVYAVGASTARVWREWSTPLGDRASVRNEFVLPAGLGTPQAVEFRIDLLPNPDAGCDLVLNLNGQHRVVLKGGIQRKHAALIAEDYFDDVAAAQGRDREPARAWYRLRMPNGLLVPGEPVSIELTARAAAGARKAECLTIFGDYPGRPHSFDGPALASPDRRADTSLYRYLATGDFRMRRRTPLVGSGRSSFFDGRTRSDTDLSPEPGRQFGRYRIFLVLSYPNRVVVL